MHVSKKRFISSAVKFDFVTVIVTYTMKLQLLPDMPHLPALSVWAVNSSGKIHEYA